jgi:hypothetical protein
LRLGAERIANGTAIRRIEQLIVFSGVNKQARLILMVYGFG